MKKIILVSVILTTLLGSSFSQKFKERWKKERFSLGIIVYTNIPIVNNDFGYGLSLSTRVFKFVSIETNLKTNTYEIYGEANLKLYPIPKTYIRGYKFNKRDLSKRIYMYLNTSFDTFNEIGAGIGIGYNINNKWRTEIRISNKTKNKKIILNPYFGFGFFRNLNFKEYPPKIHAKY